jgi:hypothetical protein
MIDLCEIAWAIGSDVAERTWMRYLSGCKASASALERSSIDDKDKEL